MYKKPLTLTAGIINTTIYSVLSIMSVIYLSLIKDLSTLVDEFPWGEYSATFATITEGIVYNPTLLYCFYGVASVLSIFGLTLSIMTIVNANNITQYQKKRWIFLTLAILGLIVEVMSISCYFIQTLGLLGVVGQMAIITGIVFLFIDYSRHKQQFRNYEYNKQIKDTPKFSDDFKYFDSYTKDMSSTQKQQTLNKLESSLDTLKKYHELYVAGAISEEEYNKIKNKILNENN